MHRVLPHLLLPLLALLLWGAGIHPALARGEDRESVRRQAARAAATELVSIWRSGDLEQARVLALRATPDPYRVLIAVLGEAEVEDDRRELLAWLSRTFSSAGAGPLAGQAQTWAEADAEAVASVRTSLARLVEIESAVLDRSLSNADARRQVGAMQLEEEQALASVLTLWLHWRLLGATTRHTETLRIGKQLSDRAHALGWHRMTLEVEAQRARLLQGSGQRTVAIEAYRRAAEAARALGEDALEASALKFAVVLTMHRGDLLLRYELQLRLAELMKEHAPESVRLRTQLWLIDAEVRLNALSSAARRATHLLQRAKAMNDASLVCNAITQLFRVRVGQGRLADALALEGRVRAARNAVEDVNDRSRAASAIATLLRDLGRYDEALELCEETLEEVGEGRSLVLTAAGPMLSLTASILGEMGRAEDARAAWRRAATLYARHQQVGRLVSALVALGRYELAAGRIEEARVLAAEALRQAPQRSPRSLSLAHRFQSSVARAGGDAQAALAAADRALGLASRGEVPPGELAHLQATRGLALQHLERHADASHTLEQATRLLLGVARGVGERHGLGLRARAHDVARAGFRSSAYLAHLHASNTAVRRAHLAKAWWFREASHALSLASRIRGQSDLRDRVTPEQRRALQAALRSLSRVHRKAIEAERQHAPGAPVRREAEAALERAHVEYVRSVAAVEGSAARHTMSSSSAPVPLEQFQSGLDPETCAVAYIVAKDRLHGMAIRREQVRLVDLGPLDEIAATVEAWRDLVSAPGGPTTILGRRLHRTLLEPFSELMADSTRLLVLPDGPIAALPLGALVAETAADGSPRTYVLDERSIRYIPSAAVGRALGHQAELRGRGVVCLADPYYRTSAGGTPPLPRLLGSRAEAERTASYYPDAERTLWLGRDASLARWTAQFPAGTERRLRSLHMACHGRIDAVRPYLSGLVLAGGEVLTAEHVQRSRIAADLIVLSACQTAVGQTARGEGVMGLTRAFFHAGASRVVVSTWAVADEATADLMSALHQRFADGHVSAEEALHEARLVLRRGGGVYAHPYYWAPFVLWGNS